MIEFEHVYLRLGNFQLEDVSFTIDEGDYFFIIGPSGAGKTVLLEAIAGLHIPDSGKIRMRGEDVMRIPPEKRRLSLVYQDYSLFPHMTVYNNIAFGLKMQKLPKNEIRSRVNEIMDSFGIAHLAKRHPMTMSGGEQQRVAIARALTVEPDILLLDEPLAALDPVLKEQFIQELRKIHRDHNLTIVQVTHARGEAVRLATKVAVIIEGRLAAEGRIKEVFETPRTREVARFVGIENVLEGRIVAQEERVVRIDVAGKMVTAVAPCEVGEQVSVCVRAEDVIISAGEEKTSARNVFPGEVIGIESMGPTAKVTLDCGFPLVATVLQDSARELDLEPGREVFASFKATAVHCTREFVK